MPTWLISVFIIAGSVLISLAGLVAARKLFKPATLRKHHELAGNILAVVGTLNAVLLGLVILEAQNRFQQARNNEAAESSNIGDMRLYAEYLREPTRSAINKHVGSYVKLVRGVEWDSPPELQPNKEAVEEFHCLWHLVCEYAPANSKEQNLQASMLQSLTQAFDERRFRITDWTPWHTVYLVDGFDCRLVCDGDLYLFLHGPQHQNAGTDGGTIECDTVDGYFSGLGAGQSVCRRLED